MSRTLAYAPADGDFKPVIKGDAASFIDLCFVPVDAKTWDDDQPGAGILRLRGDGSIELLEYIADHESGGFRLTQADWAELQASLEPGYW